MDLETPTRVHKAEKPTGTDLCFKDAVELSRMLRAREISAVEAMTAFLSQVKRVNPKVNAICTFIGEEAAMQAAHDADQRLGKGQARGPLEGFPHAVKDLIPTAGIRTTQGSRIYKDFVPESDALIVERLKRAGAIIIGKTNTPEFGAGSQTFNEVFGATLNPYDLTKTCGGSSGGAAVALACGMVPLADGSDMGGSLRNPASFCNVVGFRTSPGRVPVFPNLLGWNTLSVEGPMARNVRDVAFLLSIIAGPDPRSPISLDEPGSAFLRPLQRDFNGTRIAWSRNLGRYPVQPIVSEVCDKARSVFASLGCRLEEEEPDFDGADEIFQVLRAWSFAQNRSEDLKHYRHLIKDTVIWNVEQGLRLSGLDVSRAEASRTELFHRVRSFMERYEFLVLPVSQVVPFPVEQEWVEEINGIRMETYIDWMATCYAITVTGLPAISVPCGFTGEGLPVGLQIIGGHQRDFDVLQLAYAFEQATQYGKVRPPVAKCSSGGTSP
ncbi:MAG TPA: amidase [Blastocatellia bacterium]|nr:amidase [Blastocatellia bacterium]